MVNFVNLGKSEIQHAIHKIYSHVIKNTTKQVEDSAWSAQSVSIY